MKKYFKKFSVIVVMLLALIGIGAIQNGITANAATVGQQLTSAEAGWKRFDDNYSNIKYSGSYGDGDATAKLQYFNKTYSVMYNDGSCARFNFKGSEIRIIGALGTIRSNNILIEIDGVDYRYNAQSSSSKFQYIEFEKLGLNYEEHTVKIAIDSQTTVGSSGMKSVDIDAIDIDLNGELLPYNESITLDKSSMDLNQGDSGQLTATTTPAAVGVTWASSDTSVATVDSTGKVTAVGAGTATITATTTDGSNLSASCAVNVTANNGGTTTGASAIVNIAYAKGDNTNNAGGDVSIIFNGVPDTTLSVVKTASVKSVWVGDTFTYTIVVTNTGSKTAKAVVINDSAPNHIQFMPSGITTTQGTVHPSSSASKIVVNVGDISPAGTVTITVPATVVL